MTGVDHDGLAAGLPGGEQSDHERGVVLGIEGEGVALGEAPLGEGNGERIGTFV
jgi:hypothetical protein